MFNDYPALRFIVTIYRSASRADFQISSPLEREDVETRCGRETHLNFPGKDAHRVHFNPRGTPPTKYGRETVREGVDEERSMEGGETLWLHVCGWWFKSERPVSRARPKREQLIVMCGGCWGILIFPLNAENGSAFWLRRGLRKRRRGVESLHDRHRSYPETCSFFYELPAAETTRRRSAWNCRREEHKRDRIWIRSTVLFYVHYLKTFVKRLQTIVWEAALYTVA